MLTAVEVTSPLLPSPRKAWLQPSLTGQSPDCLIFLDGELYIEHVKAPEILHDLQSTGQPSPFTSIYLSSPDAAARHIDFTCNETYSLFLATDLRRWLENVAGTYKRYFLCGLSLTRIFHPILDLQ